MDINSATFPVRISSGNSSRDDSTVIQMYKDCFQLKGKVVLNVEDLAEMIDQVINLSPKKRNVDCIADIVDIILVKLIKRANKFHESFEFPYEFLQNLIDSRFQESDNILLLLSFLMLTCGMAKEPFPSRFSLTIREIHKYFRRNAPFFFEFDFTRQRLNNLKALIIDNDTIIDRYSSIFKMSFDTVKSIVSSALIWVFIPVEEIRYCYGFVFPKGIAIGQHPVWSWPDGFIVIIIIHELAHFLLRRKNGAYDALFSTGESKLSRKRSLDDEVVNRNVEEKYVQESGCYACEHIVGPPFCMCKAVSKYDIDSLYYSNVLMENLQNTKSLPLAPLLTENLLLCKMKEDDYWCTDGLYCENEEIDPTQGSFCY